MSGEMIRWNKHEYNLLYCFTIKRKTTEEDKNCAKLKTLPLERDHKSKKKHIFF